MIELIISVLWKTFDYIFSVVVSLFYNVGLDFRVVVIAILCCTLIINGIVRPFLANKNDKEKK